LARQWFCAEEEEEESVSDLSPAEITWQFMLIAKTPTQVDSDGGTTKLAFTDPSEVSWIMLLAKDGLIEIIDQQGVIGIQGLTAKGSLILNKAPDRKTWIKVIGPIIDAGDEISLKAIEERKWHWRAWAVIKALAQLLRK
jgi:hypothetical protein